jgi:hypothetical protein
MHICFIIIITGNYKQGKSMGSRDKKYWISLTTPFWVLILILSFVAFFPAFVALMIMWAVGRIEVS